MKQVKHWRTSKYGRKFEAGSRVETEKEEPEGIEIFDKEKEYELSDEDLDRIKEETGLNDENQIIQKMTELDSDDVDELIDSINSEKED